MEDFYKNETSNRKRSIMSHLQILDIPLFCALTNKPNMSGFRVTPHWHKEIEILLVFEGNARQQCGNFLFDISEGDIVVIGRNQIHSTDSPKEKTFRFTAFVFDIDKLIPYTISENERTLIKDFSDASSFFNASKQESGIMSELRASLDIIRNEYESQNYGYELKIRQKIFEFIYTALKTKAQNQIDIICPANDPEGANILRNTFLMIEKKYADSISLGQAAATSNLSISHFCRLFRKTTGFTFMEYLNMYRICMAEALLMSKKTVTEAAYECGFGSFTSFLRSFRKYRGCTPSELKKLLQNTD